MEQHKYRSLLKALALVLVDVVTIWMMAALCEMRVAFFPWCMSYLFLSAGLLNVSIILYRGLAREVAPFFASSLLAASGIFWGYTVAVTFIAFVFPYSAFYHSSVLVGLAIYTFYNLVMLRRLNQKQPVLKQPERTPVKAAVSSPAVNRADTAVLVINLGENMSKLRPFLTAEDYSMMETAYWNTADSLKELPKVEENSSPDMQELERRMTSKLSEINGQMKLIPDVSGEKQRVLVTDVITSMEIIKSFALHMTRLRNGT